MTPATTAPVWLNEPRAPGPVATAREVWRNRRFLKYLGVRVMRKLYARTVLGWLWLLILPLFPILIRVVVFGGLLGLTAEGIPYFLFVTVGTVSWAFFATALVWSTRGLELNRKVLKFVYVPRLILPLAALAPAAFELAIHLGVLALVVLFYWMRDGTPYIVIGMHSFWSLAALACILVLVLGIGLFTSVWGESARDARFAIAYFSTIWFLLTPILYPVSAIAPRYRAWLYANPMASFVEAFKYGLLRMEPPDPARFAVAVATSLALLAGGMLFFAGRDDQDVEE